MSSTPTDPPSACPVDNSTRLAWLENAAKESRAPLPHQLTSPLTPATPSPSPLTKDPPPLNDHRSISSIPRADTSPATTTPLPTSPPATTPPPSANWIYPSEKMFFDAMARKSHSPAAADMRTIVPIHNAVNERAWSLIRSWETTSPRLRAANASCGGPRLRSFRGDSKALTPRARVYGWLGYERPFDRHDWVVERCGREGGEVEYVIDFYRGRGSGGEGAGLSFYLDVRPKLNSWEGVRMRVGRLFGFY